MPSPLRKAELRPFVRQVVVPPWAVSGISGMVIHNIADERRVLWHTIERRAVIRSQGRKLWATLGEFNRYWPEFKSYIAQARLYDDAAQSTQGASSALLAYYSALNLAKAELLITTPTDIYEKTISHGLSYGPSKRTIRSDFVRTRAGVFPLLYTARTGLTVPMREELPILKLLANVTDVGYELGAADLGLAQAGPIQHLVASDYANQSWSVVTFPEESPAILGCPVSRRFLGDHFEQINDMDAFRSSLRLAPIASRSARQALQAKRIYQPPTDVQSMMSDVESMVRPVQGHRIYSHDEWAPSLRRSKWLPMPPDLARYAAMFYCSSVVRYRPSFIHDDTKGEAAWILNSFVSEARLLLLRSAVRGITGQHPEIRQGDEY